MVRFLYLQCIQGLLLALISVGLATPSDQEDTSLYIVYMGEKPGENISPESLHVNLLDQVIDGRSSGDALVRSYSKSFHGFAAKLTEREQRKIAGMEGIVSVFKSRTLQLHTTRSWDFLGFHRRVKRRLTIERDVIVGIIDSGIWPESESFRDQGFSPPPKRWKGVCQSALNFTCNKKIIGARFYGLVNAGPEEMSPRDTIGHGTHTASTVAGFPVENISFYGLANGTVRGAVPSSRIAVYKVCFRYGCPDDQILAAFDDAISDGVDIISISIGNDDYTDYFSDSIAIGSFHAMKKGIFTSTSAGNNGPDYGSVVNFAPWMLSVAASSTDRKIVTEVLLGNNETLVGTGLNSIKQEEGFFPIVFAQTVANKSASDGDGAEYCDLGTLDRNLVKGKVVICNSSYTLEPYRTGARAALLPDFDDAVDSSSNFIPSASLKSNDITKLKQYIHENKHPVCSIPRSKCVLDPRAPIVAPFSSRGPNPITRDILKPDLSAPGVDILAAWSPVGPVAGLEDKRSVEFNVFSGTSMACPHATGTAVYVKSFHPNWSPAAILSALITTAIPMDPRRHQNAEFDYGAGQLNPLAAIHPGLIYDASPSDFVQLLCNQGYDTKKVRLITSDKSSCPIFSEGSVKDHNYPSMAARVKIGKPFNISFSRTVTNVGFKNSLYKAQITAASHVKVTVIPNSLYFNSLWEKKNFIVRVEGKGIKDRSIMSSSITWFDGRRHRVRSPIVVYAGTL